MKPAVVFLFGLFLLTRDSQAEVANDLRDNPLVADLLLIVPDAATGSISKSPGVRSPAANHLPNANRYTLTFNRPSTLRRPAPTRTYSGARQAQFYYFPHYAGRSTIGVANRRKPALAPLPITYTPFSDPFYEEKVLQEVLRDGSGYYPQY